MVILGMGKVLETGYIFNFFFLSSSYLPSLLPFTFALTSLTSPPRIQDRLEREKAPKGSGSLVFWGWGVSTGTVLTVYGLSGCYISLRLCGGW